MPDPSSVARSPVALVTGGSRGIGRAVCLALGKRGVEVHFTYHQGVEAAAEVCEQILQGGGSARAWQVDARDIAASQAVVASLIGRAGRLDVLVNNAGIVADRLLPLMTEEQWSSVLTTSLNGLYGTTRPAATQMMRQRTGRIVNMTSVSGIVGVIGQTNYCAAKAAIIGFTRALAKEVARTGVAVNAVAPGFIDTEMTASLSEKQRAAAMEQVPMRRFGQASEVANLVCYLLMDAPAYLSGQVLAIDGGMTA